MSSDSQKEILEQEPDSAKSYFSEEFDEKLDSLITKVQKKQTN